jgi:CDP-glucose 4,6-dehydratase
MGLTTLHSGAAGDWSQCSVLVTGASGFVGSRLVQRLIDAGAHVSCFVRHNDPASPLWNSDLLNDVTIINGRLEDYTSIKAAVAENQFDAVFHLGAQAIVSVGSRDPLGTFESNIAGTYNLLEACRLYGASINRIIVASSDKAYGECDAGAYQEHMALAARNPYDVSKSCADLVAQSYFHTYKMPIAIARCGNIFGPGDLHWSRLVPGTIRSLLRGERPIIRSDGTLVRDYLFVEDAVSGYLALAQWLQDKQSDHQHAFNFSSNHPMNVLAMTALLQHACGRCDLAPVIERKAAGEIQNQQLDCSRAHSILNWRPVVALADAIEKTVSWYATYLNRNIHDRRLLFTHVGESRRATA